MDRSTIKVDTSQMERLVKELKDFPKQAGEAAYHAINRTLDHVKTQIGRIIPQNYTIKSKEVKETLKVNRPTKSNLSASITSTGRRLTFVHFQLSPRAPLDKNKRYRVKVQIKRGSGKKVVTTDPKPFINTTRAKSADKTQYNIFKRVGKARKPIEVLHTVSVPQMITNKQVSEEIQKAAGEKLNERLEHELTRVMTNASGRIKKG